MGITKDQVMPLLLEAAPGFDPAWRKHLAWWGGKERGAYNDVAEFAHYVVESYAASETAEFEAVFATVERVVREGDTQARDLATIGLLEGIQTIASHHPFGASVFAKWLGPLSGQAWQEIEQLWRAGGGSLAGVVRLENRLSARRARRWWQFWKGRAV